MEELLRVALEQSPSLAVLVFLVFYFIRYIRGRDEASEKTAAHMTQVVEKNSEVIGSVTEVIRKCTKMGS